jgi:hypothetical protein
MQIFRAESIGNLDIEVLKGHGHAAKRTKQRGL